MHLVSIIIPAYNSVRTVGEAIDSALSQTYQAVEVIVVDDGSKDATVEVLKGYGNRIRWRTGPNQGACAARNAGLELAQGELIQFLDADDLLFRNKLQQQVPLIVEDHGQLVFCDAEIRSEQGATSLLVRRDACVDAVVFALGGSLQTSAPLHWKSTLQAVGGFRIDLPCAQERDLHLRLAASGLRFERLPEVLYAIRRQASSLSSSYRKVLDQHAGILWPVYRQLQKSDQLTEARARAFAGLMARDAREYLRQGHTSAAADYFRQAREMHPTGGLDTAYGRSTRWLVPILGAGIVERLSSWWRE